MMYMFDWHNVEYAFPFLVLAKGDGGNFVGSILGQVNQTLECLR